MSKCLKTAVFALGSLVFRQACLANVIELNANGVVRDVWLQGTINTFGSDDTYSVGACCIGAETTGARFNISNASDGPISTVQVCVEYHYSLNIGSPKEWLLAWYNDGVASGNSPNNASVYPDGNQADTTGCWDVTPLHGSWTWTDVQNAEITLGSGKAASGDSGTFLVDRVLLKVTYADLAGSVTPTPTATPTPVTECFWATGIGITRACSWTCGNAFGNPDSVFANATGAASSNDGIVSIGGINFAGHTTEVIQSVKIKTNLYVTGALTDDHLDTTAFVNGAMVPASGNAGTYSTAFLNTALGAGSKQDLLLDISLAKAWTWADFNGNFEIYENYAKSGADDGQTIKIDSIGICITYIPYSIFTATLTRTFTSSPTPVFTFTLTPSPTATLSPTPTATFSPTFTYSFTQTFTDTFTQSFTFSYTNSPTDTPSETPTETFTDTPTKTFTPTPTDSPTSSLTFTESFTDTFTDSPTETPTQTPTESFTETSTKTYTPTDSFTLTFTETFTNSHTNTYTDSPTDTPTDTGTETFTLTFTPTQTPTDSPTETFTNSPTDTPTETPTETFTLTYTKTFTPTDSFTLTFTETSTNSFTDTFTDTATDTPTRTFSLTFTPSPTDTATDSPTAAASLTDSMTATPSLTVPPTDSATATLSPTVTDTPAFVPSPTPTASPVATVVLGPNPATTGGTTLSAYSGGEPVQVRIYTVSGELVWRSRASAPGQVTFHWDLSTPRGGEASEGLYLLVIEGPGYRERRSLVVFK